jgi:hypothetical protein
MKQTLIDAIKPAHFDYFENFVTIPVPFPLQITKYGKYGNA